MPEKIQGFFYDRKALCGEGIALSAIAEDIGTPCYIYSLPVLRGNADRFRSAFHGMDVSVCYAVKANRSLTILHTLAQQGFGFDLVSGGELSAALRAGGDPGKMIYSGVGKTKEEITQALKTGILQFNVESCEEMECIRACARELQRTAPVALRVNPDVEASTHQYIHTGSSQHKFGIDFKEVPSLVKAMRRWKELRFQGLACHIGSQICSLDPFEQAFRRMAGLCRDLRSMGISLTTIDLGGGLGIRYRKETPIHLPRYAGLVQKYFGAEGIRILLEPGRFLLADAGLLLTRLLYRKETRGKRFYIVDAGMNDLIRPTLYQAWHEILPLRQIAATRLRKTDVVGPLCETGDFLAKQRELPGMKPGTFLAVMQAAAYGYAQASNYNARGRAAEVFLDGAQWQVTRPRETVEDLFQKETIAFFNSTCGTMHA